MSLRQYPEYKDSGVERLGEVPAHWEVDRLKRSVVSCRNGIWGDNPESDANDIPCVRVADFDRQRLRVELSDPTIRSITQKERAGRLLRRGDLLLEKSGGGELQPVGCVVLYDDDTPAVCSNFVARVELAAEMNPSFWRYQHTAAYAVRLNTRSIKQTSGIQNLDAQQYLDERGAFPPVEEQAQIAEFLDRETAKIDALVAEQQRLIELLKEKRQAVISHAVTKGLNSNAPMKDSGIEWLGEVPAHWEVKRLRNVSPRLAGRLIVQPHLYFEDNGVPIVFGNNIQRGRICLDEIKRISFEADERFAGSRVSAGDLLTVRVGDPGATAVVPKTLDGCHFASTMLIRKSRAFDSQWLCHVMNSHIVGLQIDRVCYGAAQEQFNIRDAADFLVPFPPLSEQSRLAAFLDRATTSHDDLTDETSRAINLLTERRTALISAAVTGQIDVRQRAQKA